MVSSESDGAGYALSLCLEPDTEGLVRLHDLDDLPADDVLRAVQQLRVGRGQPQDLPPQLMRISAIRYAALTPGASFVQGLSEGDESAVLKDIFDRLSAGPAWLGLDRDLLALRMRSLICGVCAGPALDRIGTLQQALGFSSAVGLAELAGMPRTGAQDDATVLLLLSLRWRMCNGSLDAQHYRLALAAVAQGLGGEHALADWLSRESR